MRYITDLVLVSTRSDVQLRAEVLALRHQLRVLERKVGKPAWQPADRILLAGLSRLLRRSGLPSPLPKPETLLRWHRDPVGRKWAAFRQRPPRQHPVRDSERKTMTLKLVEENPNSSFAVSSTSSSERSPCSSMVPDSRARCHLMPRPMSEANGPDATEIGFALNRSGSRRPPASSANSALGFAGGP